MVKIGAIYNIGIGNGDRANCEVVRIDKDAVNGDIAILEMVNFGGPRQTVFVASLEK